MDTTETQDIPAEGPKPKKQKLTGIKWKSHSTPIEPDRNKNEDFHRGYRDRSPLKHSRDRERSPEPGTKSQYRDRTPPRDQRRRDDERRRDDRYDRDSYRARDRDDRGYDRDSYRPRDRDDRGYDRYDSRREERRDDRRREQDRRPESQRENSRDAEQATAAPKVDSAMSQSVADKFGLPASKSKDKDKQKKTPRVTAPSEPMIIVNINDRLGTKASIPCLASDSVKAFKAIVAAHIGRQPHEIMLKRQGERPFKDQLTLEDYGVSSGVQLDLEIDTGS